MEVFEIHLVRDCLYGLQLAPRVTNMVYIWAVHLQQCWKVQGMEVGAYETVLSPFMSFAFHNPSTTQKALLPVCFLIPSPKFGSIFSVSFSPWHPFILNPPSVLFRVPSRDIDSTHRVQNNNKDKRIGSWGKNMSHSQLKVYLITVDLFSFLMSKDTTEYISVKAEQGAFVQAGPVRDLMRCTWWKWDSQIQTENKILHKLVFHTKLLINHFIVTNHYCLLWETVFFQMHLLNNKIAECGSTV